MSFKNQIAIELAFKTEAANLAKIKNDFNKLVEEFQLSDEKKGLFEGKFKSMAFEFEKVLSDVEKQMLTKEFKVGKLKLEPLTNQFTKLYTDLHKSLNDVFTTPELDKLYDDLSILEGHLAKVKNEAAEANQKLEDIYEKHKATMVQEGLTQRGMSATDVTTKVSTLKNVDQEKELPQLLEAAAQGVDALRKKYDELYNSSKTNYTKQKQQLKDRTVKLIRYYQLYKTSDQERVASANQLQTLTTEQIKLEKRKATLIQNIAKIETNMAKSGPAAASMQKLAKQIDELRQVTLAMSKADTEHSVAKADANRETKALIGTNKQMETSFAGKAGAAAAYYVVFRQLRRLYQESLRTITSLDKAMTDAAIVTSMNRQEAWELFGTYKKLAQQAGVTTKDISEVTVQFLRQGRTVKDALELAEVAAKSAKIASITATDAVDYLTSAVNGFGLAAKQAVEVADKFAALGAQSASSFEEIAKAMSKVAPTAKSAGIGIDFMMGVIAKGIETTREAPENIGTAMKTIFARMREVTSDGKALEDGMSLNRVERALLSIGIPLRDITGQFRNLEQVLIDVGDKWDTLTSIEQAYLATALAGSRQQPRLLAVYNDFARTKELIQISADATGELTFQHMAYMQGMEAAMINLKTAWEGFIITITSSEVIIQVIGLLTDTINGLSFVLGQLAGSEFYMFGLMGLTTALIITRITLTMADRQAQRLLNIEKLKAAGIEKKSILWRIADIKTRLFSILVTLKNTLFIKHNRLALIRNTKAKIANKTVTIGLTISVMLATITQIKFTEALKGTAKALGSLIKKLYQAVVAMFKFLIGLIKVLAMSGAPGWAILAMGAVVAGVAIAFAVGTSKSEDFGESVLETAKNLSELNKEAKRVDGLVKRFDELAKSVRKTNEELTEMNELEEELSEITLKDKEGQEHTFDLVTTDYSGRQVLDTEEYERYLAMVRELDRSHHQDAARAFIEAFKNIKPEDILADKVLKNYFLQQGYNYGMSLIEGIEDGLSDERTQGLETALRTIIEGLNDDMMLEILDLDITETEAPTARGASARKDRDNNRGLYSEDFEKWLIESGGYTESDLKEIKNKQGLWINKAKKEIQAAYEQMKLEEALGEGFEKIVENAMKALETAGKNLDAELERIEAGQIYKGIEDKDQAMAQAQIDAYNDMVAQLTEEYKDDEETLVLMIDALGATFESERILAMLQDRNVPLDVIVNIKNPKALLEFFEKVETAITEKILEMTGEDIDPERLAAWVQSSMKNTGLLKGLDFGFAGNFEGMFSEIDFNRLEALDFSRAEIENLLREQLGIKDVGTIVSDLSAINNSLKGLFDLPAQLAKGDFSNFAELVTEFGFEAARGIALGTGLLSNAADQSLKNVQKIVDAQVDAASKDINDSINFIIEAAKDDGRELSEAELIEIETLELMLAYQEQIIGYELIRTYRLEASNKALEYMNNLYSLQNNLLALGIDYSNAFVQNLENLQEIYSNIAQTNLTQQLEDEIAALKAFGEFNESGDFIFNLTDDFDTFQAEQLLQNVMDTTGKLVDMQNKEFERRKKIIEDTYKAEQDALKSGFDERWKQIEYTDKLRENEEKLLAARRQLMGMQLGGISAGVLKQTEEDLRKIQQERQKMIEQDMMGRAQKQLEEEMQERILEVQEEVAGVIREQLEALNYLSIAIEGLTDAMTDNTEATEENTETTITTGSGGGPKDIVILEPYTLGIR
jgi:TP901 family phage tail tape measure protein